MKTLITFILLVSSVSAHADKLVIGAEAKKGVSIVDPSADNKLLWTHPVGAVHDLHLLPNGHILTQDGWPKIIEVDLDGNVVWTYDATKENREDGLAGDRSKKIEIHAYQRLPDGNTMIAESGASRIIEVTPEKEIVKEFPLEVSKSNAHSDTRLVRKLDDGRYLVAHEADQTVKEYDADGKVVWEFEVPLFGKKPKKGHGPGAFGGKCFAAIKSRNGNYLIATGNGHSVLEVTPEKEIVWKLEQNDLDGIVLAWVTTLEELDNGNLVIGNCHAGPDNPQIFEITRDKEVVWSFNDFENFGNALANSIVLRGAEAVALRAKLSVSSNQ